MSQGWLPVQWFIAQAFFRKWWEKAFTTWGGPNPYLLRGLGFQRCGLQYKVRDPKITASDGECQQTYHLNKPQHLPNSHLPQNTQLPELPQDALPHTHQRKSILVQELRLLRLEDGKKFKTLVTWWVLYQQGLQCEIMAQKTNKIKIIKAEK